MVNGMKKVHGSAGDGGSLAAGEETYVNLG
jgi:hypothetical protein